MGILGFNLVTAQIAPDSISGNLLHNDALFLLIGCFYKRQRSKNENLYANGDFFRYQEK